MYKYCVYEFCPLLPLKKSTISPILTSMWFAQFCLSMRDFLQISILPNISQPRLSRQTQNSSRRKKWQKGRRKKGDRCGTKCIGTQGKGEEVYIGHQVLTRISVTWRLTYLERADSGQSLLQPWLRSPAIGLWSSENVGLLHLQSLPKLCSLSDPKMHLVRYRAQNFNLHITWLMDHKVQRRNDKSLLPNNIPGRSWCVWYKPYMEVRSLWLVSFQNCQWVHI